MLIGIVVSRCQGHQIFMQKRETVILNMNTNPDEVAQYEDPKLEACFKSLGITRQEGNIHGESKIQRFVTYAVSVSSATKAKHMIKKIASKVPEFLDDDDQALIDSIIDVTMTEMRQKREAMPTALELQVNYQSVRFSLTIQ